MSTIVPLAVAVPLLSAALVAGGGHWLPRRADDVFGIAVAAATTTLTALVLVRSVGSPFVYWFGGWRPRNGVALGISFSADPLGAGLALLGSVLVLAALVYSWRYFDEVGTLFHVLALLFLGGLVGFAFTGDLFTLFVFLELTGTAAFALTAYRIEEVGPVQGAVGFAVTNTIGAIFVLTGIALLYGRTGALNLAQIGRALSGEKPDGLVVVAFVMLASGFLIKAGAVPFHFRLSDAYAVAPAPICVLFAGVMTELGLYAFARVYWTVFAAPFGAHAGAVRGILLGLGLFTAVVGATMSFLQRHLKRLLAYSSIAYTGLFLTGIGLLTPQALGGAAVFVLAHGLAKGSLFLLTGGLLERTESVDELHLRGHGRAYPYSAAGWLLASLALAAPPFIGAFRGHALIGDAAATLGDHWLAPALAVVTAVSTGAILRAGARVFLGWGAEHDPLLSPEPEEGPQPRAPERPDLVLVAPAIVLAAAALAIGGLTTLGTHAQQAAERFENAKSYAAQVLDARPAEAAALPPQVTTGASMLWSLVSTGGAVAVALFGLYRRRLPDAARATVWRVLELPVDGLRAFHSGHVGDYVAWLTFGTAVLGGLFALVLT